MRNSNFSVANFFHIERQYVSNCSKSVNLKESLKNKSSKSIAHLEKYSFIFFSKQCGCCHQQNQHQCCPRICRLYFHNCLDKIRTKITKNQNCESCSVPFFPFLFSIPFFENLSAPFPFWKKEGENMHNKIVFKCPNFLFLQRLPVLFRNTFHVRPSQKD